MFFCSGFFNEDLSVDGSILRNIIAKANATVGLNPTEQYVLVLGNVQNPTSVTYQLQSTGTKTLPGVGLPILPGGHHSCARINTTELYK